MTLCQPKSLSASSLCCLCCLLCTSNHLVLHLLEVFRRYCLQTICGTETKWQVLRRVCRKQTKVFANLMSHIFNLVNCFSVPRVNVMRSEALLADAAFVGGFSWKLYAHHAFLGSFYLCGDARGLSALLSGQTSFHKRHTLPPRGIRIGPSSEGDVWGIAHVICLVNLWIYHSYIWHTFTPKQAFLWVFR